MFDSMFGGGSPDQCQEGDWEGHKYGALFCAVAEGDEYTLRSLFREPKYKSKGGWKNTFCNTGHVANIMHRRKLHLLLSVYLGGWDRSDPKLGE